MQVRITAIVDYLVITHENLGIENLPAIMAEIPLKTRAELCSSNLPWFKLARMTSSVLGFSSTAK